MKKSLLFNTSILILLFFLINNCSVNNINSYNNKDISIISNQIFNNHPSYEKIRKKIEAYFNRFCSQNKNFSMKSFEAKELTNAIGTWVNGYFYGEKLAWIQLATFGDMQERFSNYYIINNDLVYVITNLYKHYPDSMEESMEMFIINGKAWTYDRNDTLILSQESDAEMEIYEIIRKKLANDNPVYWNNYVQTYDENKFDKLKTNYFVDYYLHNNTYKQEKYKFNDFDVIIFLENENLKRICLQIYDNSEYKKYNYYVMNNDIIYVVVFHQEYKDKSGDNIFGKSFYEQYYIYNDKIMEYDYDTNGLKENLCYSYILEYFNDAKSHFD